MREALRPQSRPPSPPLCRGRRASGFPEGDVNGADGYSPFPGNINQLIMAVPQYAAVLERTGACGAWGAAHLA